MPKTVSPFVGFVRPELARLMGTYRKIRDCLSGEDAVKLATTKYLPMPGGAKGTQLAKDRYEEYITRAVFYNVTKATLNGFVGQVFAGKTKINLPAAIADMEANVDGAGVGIEQQSKRALEYALAYSRGGLLVDYPRSDGPMTATEIKEGRMRPTISLYSPQTILNWRLIEHGAEDKLALVVLYESYASADDGFEIKLSPQFRVLRLDEQGYYVQEIWRETYEPSVFNPGSIPGRDNTFSMHEVLMPKDASGKRLTEIPFVPFGSENNDIHPDTPNMQDIANLNLAHYRNSADYEESCFVVGQPTTVFAGVDQEWVEMNMGGRLSLGTRVAVPLPAGASASILQAQPNNMIKEAMDTKERQMVALGARLVEQRTVQRTAYEASTEESGKTSVLASTAKNVSEAYRRALELALLFAPKNRRAGEVEFALNTDFAVSRMTPEQQKNVVELWQQGALTFSEMRNTLFHAGTATIEDADEAAGEIEAEGLRAQAAAERAMNSTFNVGDNDADE